MFLLNESTLTLPRHSGDDALAFVEQAAYELSIVESTAPFTALVVSWNVDAPPGSSARFEARVRYAPRDGEPESGEWSSWRVLGVWGQEDKRLPHSVAEEEAEDDTISVAIDVLKLASGYEASAFQVRVTLYRGEGAPVVRMMAASLGLAGGAIAEDEDTPANLGETLLQVPARSQHAEDPSIENEICSPTSLGMVMAYYGVDHPTAQVAAGVYDHGAEIYGNWPFNTAYAGAHGLRAVVRHFRGMRELEQELHAGHPVIVSIAFEPGEFPESPTRRTSGHLLVVTGVTASGDFYVNDPDADPRHDQPINRIYSRANLRRAWLPHGGVAYVLSKA